MKLFAIAAACLMPGILATLTYEDSIRALVYNRIEPVDDSQGEVWFDASSYKLADLGFDDIGNRGYYTYGSYNYLTKVLGLASIANQKNLYGDLVFLMYKFLYAGNPANTDISTNSSMMLDLASRLDKAVSKRDGSSLVDTLVNSSSVSELAGVFVIAENFLPPEDKNLMKRWDSICGSAHKAVKNACRALANAVERDYTWTSGGPRHREYGGCFVSWSANVSLHIHDLYSPMSSCLNACGSATISCRTKNVRINGKDISVCVSNRHNGCRN